MIATLLTILIALGVAGTVAIALCWRFAYADGAEAIALAAVRVATFAVALIIYVLIRIALGHAEARIVAGVTGTAVLLGVINLIGWAIRRHRRPRAATGKTTKL